jgi:hypothetical protein
MVYRLIGWVEPRFVGTLLQLVAIDLHAGTSKPRYLNITNSARAFSLRTSESLNNPASSLVRSNRVSTLNRFDVERQLSSLNELTTQVEFRLNGIINLINTRSGKASNRTDSYTKFNWLYCRSVFLYCKVLTLKSLSVPRLRGMSNLAVNRMHGSPCVLKRMSLRQLVIRTPSRPASPSLVFLN